MFSVLLAFVSRHPIPARALALLQLPFFLMICAALAQMPGLVRPVLAMTVAVFALFKIYQAFFDTRSDTESGCTPH
ncbi:hypothetical protein [Sulfitobacter sp. NFXS29]|uniref:hypothetical protein n=1 Tax=Sulfitobacter sp. NFXS29 TaxID=2818438 RepID=UPI0032E01C19